MNNRKAKSPRRQARQITVGMPAENLCPGGRPPMFAQLPVPGAPHLLEWRKVAKGVPFRYRHGSTKGVYRAMEKEVRHGGLC